MNTAVKLLVVAGICLWSGPAWSADDVQSLKQENAELKQRLQALEQGMAEMKNLLQQQSLQLQAVRQAQQKDLQAVKALLAKDAEAKGAKQTWLGIETSLRMKLYGYIKADAAWDSARTNVGDFARWVESESGRNKDDDFNVTARESRFGLWIYGPEDENVKTSGRVEVDFYGGGYGGGAENKPNPMLRHAYLKIDWPKERFSILAGQTSDVFSPLVPHTLNYSVAWWAGNIGYRRPQVRLTKGLTVGAVDVEMAAAVARTIGHDNGDFDPGDSGEDYCLPGLQGRIGLTFPLLGERKTTIGFSGHMAKEEYDLDASDHAKDLWSWSANMDVTQPVFDWLTIKGELFTGSNLDAYLGGIGQGIDTVGRLGEIDSCGGWAAASLGPWDKWRFNLGASVEAVNGEDVTADGARTLNRSIFGNVIYSVNANTSIGFEVSQWHTEYKGDDDGDSLRLQTSFLYKF